MGGGDLEGRRGEGLAAPSLLQQTDPNGVVTGVEQVVVGVEGGKLGHTPHNNDVNIPPPSLGHHHHHQLLAMMDPPPPPPLTPTTHSHHLLTPPPASSTFNHHHHHQQLVSSAPHFQLPNQLPRYLHVLPSHSPSPSSIFPYHQQHHIDFSLPQQQQQQSHSPFSPHSHLIISPPSTLVFSSSPAPAVPTSDQPTRYFTLYILLASRCLISEAEVSKTFIEINHKEGNVEVVLNILSEMAANGLLPNTCGASTLR